MAKSKKNELIKFSKYWIYIAAALIFLYGVSAQGLAENKISLAVENSSNYTLELGQESNITSVSISGSVSQNGTARVYMEDEEGKKLIFDSSRPLFDVNVMVLPEYKSVLPGKEAVIDVSIFNLRGFGRVDAVIEYAIKNNMGRVLGSTTENATIETKAKFVRNLAVSEDILPGIYVAFVSVNVGNSSLGSSSDSFEIAEPEIKKPAGRGDFVLNASLVAMLLILISIISIYWFSRKDRGESRLQFSGKAEKLRKKLKSLEKAYQIKALSKDAYEKSRSAIEQEIRELEKKSR